MTTTRAKREDKSISHRFSLSVSSMFLLLQPSLMLLSSALAITTEVNFAPWVLWHWPEAGIARLAAPTSQTFQFCILVHQTSHSTSRGTKIIKSIDPFCVLLDTPKS